ncbi:MAG: cyanophycinase [Acidobacteriota bacterium]|nr:cyanophycinase [Blastocatellia bacterium]MDW8411212.1 cyanophycinase [Acidobacteriota bacterium]
MSKGRFFLVGGGPAARTLGEPFMGVVIEAAGGSKSRLALITAGSDDPADVNACYWEIFSALGVKHIFSPKIFSRSDANERWVANSIADCNVVFIAGGAQAKLLDKIAGTLTEKAFKYVYEAGGILAGTSAGSSIYTCPVIVEGGTQNRHLRRGMIEVRRGFGIIEGLAIDTHCSSRGRLPRLVSLLIEQPGIQAIGIDEDTALFIDENGVAEVLGYNAVYILDAKNSTAAHDDVIEEDGHLCTSGITLHCLMNGDKYHIGLRRPCKSA